MIQKEFTQYFASELFDKSVPLSEFYLLRVSGDDAFGFLQGQLTVDVRQAVDEDYLLNFCIVDLKGHIEFSGGLCHTPNEFFLITYKDSAPKLKEYLEKYIITEDVEVSLDKGNYQLSFFPHQDSIAIIQLYPNFFASIQKLDREIEQVSFDEKKVLKAFLGHAVFTIPDEITGFLPASFIHDQAVSFEKGCFKGQEILSKIEFNRKAAKKDWFVQVNSELNDISEIQIKDGKLEVLDSIEFKGSKFLHIKLNREHRLNQFEQNIKVADKEISATLVSFPIFLNPSLWGRDLGNLMFEKLSELYIKGIPAEELISMNEMCLAVFPQTEELYESIAQFLKKTNQFKKAIFWMDQLTKVNPNNVLAYTNRSLLYMNLGDIEKAEEEKAKGVALEFQLKGKNVDQQAEIEKTKRLEKEKREKQKAMFLKVLELDENDLYANLQMTRISRLENDYSSAEKYLEPIKDQLDKEPEVVLEYALLYQYKKDRQKMQEMVNLGLPLANKKGNLKVASQLQSLV